MATFTVHDLRRWVRRILLWSVGSAISLTVLAYGVDLAVFRIRLAKAGNAYGSVVVSHYYAVAQKNGKTQFIFDPPAPETCVNALFPHAGAQPCWYLRRHLELRTDI